MSKNRSFKPIDFAEQLEKIATAVMDVARDCQGDPITLLVSSALRGAKERRAT